MKAKKPVVSQYSVITPSVNGSIATIPEIIKHQSHKGTAENGLDGTQSSGCDAPTISADSLRDSIARCMGISNLIVGATITDPRNDRIDYRPDYTSFVTAAESIRREIGDMRDSYEAFQDAVHDYFPGKYPPAYKRFLDVAGEKIECAAGMAYMCQLACMQLANPSHEETPIDQRHVGAVMKNFLRQMEELSEHVRIFERKAEVTI